MEHIAGSQPMWNECGDPIGNPPKRDGERIHDWSSGGYWMWVDLWNDAKRGRLPRPVDPNNCALDDRGNLKDASKIFITP